MASYDDYLSLITSEHNQKPKYMAMLGLFATPLVDDQNLTASLPQKYDLDVAVGNQLDTVGRWIGLSRSLPVPISGVYFSWDAAGVGWDEGVWRSPFDPITGLTALDDETYRLFLKAKVGANHWDGTNAGWQTVMSYVFQGTGTVINYVDSQDMSMDVLITGILPSTLTLTLITQGYLSLKPAGVRINNYYVTSVPGAPIFAWDVMPGTGFGGWDVGAWATPL